MMELNRNQLLHALIHRTCNLYHEIEAKIHFDDGTSSFCKHCLLQHGLCCRVAQTPMEERKTLIAIRDSLKDVQDMLLFLQKSESRGRIQENTALARLEASRFLLIEKINQYPEKGGRKMEVLEELNAWLGRGNRKTALFTWKSKDHEEKLERKGKNVGGFRYAVSLFGNLLLCMSPCKWFSTTKKAIRLLIISTIITSSVRFSRRSGRPFVRANAQFLSPMDPKMPRKPAFAKNINVFSGRG